MLIYAGSSNVVVGLTVLKEVLARNFSLTYVALHRESQDINVVVSLTVLKEVLARNFSIAYVALHREPQDSRKCGIRWTLLITRTFHAWYISGLPSC